MGCNECGGFADECKCNYNEPLIDPVCVFHGKKHSEHHCLYCCICFETLTVETCATINGEKVDVCEPCAIEEREAL